MGMLRCAFYTMHFNKRKRAMLSQWKKEKLIDDEWEGEGEQRGGGERSPMVLPYGKSPAAMVNARIIGGRYARLLREAKK